MLFPYFDTKNEYTSKSQYFLKYLIDWTNSQ